MYLRGNAIGDQGATGLAEALGLNSTLERLGVRYNNVGEMVLNKLRRLEHGDRSIWLIPQNSDALTL